MQAFMKASPFIILIGLFVFFCLFNENFPKLSNFMNIIKQSAPIGIISVGMALVIITAGIDLSVGPMMAISGCVMAVLSVQLGVPVPISIIAGIAIGTCIGWFNGILVTKAHLQPFIATLGTMTAVTGLAQLITGGMPVSGLDPSLTFFGSGLIGGVFPIAGLVFAAVAAAGWIILKYTTLGRNIYAVGGNVEAARVSGIHVDRVKISAHTLSGFFCGIAGLVMLGRINSANGGMGTGYELTAITAVALGGTSMAGGVGSMLGTIIGVFTMGVLQTGLDLTAIEPYVQKVIMGIVIISVVTLDTWRGRKAREVE